MNFHENGTETRKKKRSFLLVAASAAFAVGFGTGCDLDVVNPGPVQDGFLDGTDAQEAIVNGIGRATAEALNFLSMTGAAIVREIHPSGTSGAFGIANEWQRGLLLPTDDALNTHWNNAQRARSLGEEGIDRIENLEEGRDQSLLAKAYLWTGYANRILGEHMCDGIIDGGPIEPNTVYFERAETQFSRAADLGAGEVRLAALAGRASIRVSLGDWAGATSDAAQVPDDFVFSMPYFSQGQEVEFNRIQWSSRGQPYRAHGVWSTRFEEFGLSTLNPDGDPRVPFLVQDEEGDAGIDCCGKVPWWPQQKYENRGDDIPLSKGTEMRLVEAEALLASGAWEEAMVKMNDLRSWVDLPALEASNLEEAWTHLKSERGIELWLEGRRFGDRRRWAEVEAPGSFHELEIPSGDITEGSHLVAQDLCFPTPPSEQDTNPNVPQAGG